MQHLDFLQPPHSCRYIVQREKHSIADRIINYFTVGFPRCIENARSDSRFDSRNEDVACPWRIFQSNPGTVPFHDAAWKISAAWEKQQPWRPIRERVGWKILEIGHTWAARYIGRACRCCYSLAKCVGRPRIMLIPRVTRYTPRSELAREAWIDFQGWRARASASTQKYRGLSHWKRASSDAAIRARVHRYVGDRYRAPGGPGVAGSQRLPFSAREPAAKNRRQRGFPRFESVRGMWTRECVNTASKPTTGFFSFEACVWWNVVLSFCFIGSYWLKDITLLRSQTLKAWYTCKPELVSRRNKGCSFRLYRKSLNGIHWM